MGHHYHYFTTPLPSNSTDKSIGFPYHFTSIIFFLFGIGIVYSYVRYIQSRDNYRRDYENEENDENEFPDINNYLFRNTGVHQNINRPLPPPPPAYENEERRSLHNLEPPSYDSIVQNNSINEINNEGVILENNENMLQDRNSITV